jgi:hypothetical protein
MDDTPIKPGHDPDENPAVSYERTDLDTFAVTKFGIGLALGTVIAVFAMWGLFTYLLYHQNEAMVQLPASVIQERKGLLPPQPRLQTMGDPHDAIVSRGDLRSPSVELKKLREDEAMQLSSYAWVDPNKGIVRVPVDVAKDLVLKKGLPVKVSPEGAITGWKPNPAQGVGTPSAAQPQQVYATGAAAIGSAEVIQLPEPETPESGEKK